ncbi:MAG TPA: Gfo/Idh/MocA family oxidoreductase [Bryobacteraceae bacterium]|nr:Gfo/Idh/MocA family oxidoreductase [Bryobacteraceae bacterium]
MSPKPELRIALLGQGFMGKAHSNAYAQVSRFFDIPFKLRLKVLCGTNAETLQRSAETWGWEETAIDWRSVVERNDIDLVDIALPNHLHPEAAIRAATAGKVVLCEKPLANTLEEALRMAAAARQVPNMVWFNYRRVPAIAYAKQLIDAGKLGQPYHYRGLYLQQWGPDKRRPVNWKMSRAEAGSGVVGDLLSHSIDLALFLNGKVARLTASTKIFAEGREVEDAALLLTEFANGSIGTIEASRYAIGSRNRNTFEISGLGGMLRFDLEDLNRLEFFDATDPSPLQGERNLLVTDPQHPYGRDFWKPGHILGYEHTFIAALADFLSTLTSGEPFHPNFDDGVAVQQVLAAVLRSANSQRWETV